MSVQIEFLRPYQWEARKPKAPPIIIPRAHEFIFHHTAGHHPEISLPRNESREEAIKFAQQIQNHHMNNNGWNDSGHNWLVCRNGMILAGRWFSVNSIMAGHMVVSAHCVGHNGSIGIEHEHLGDEDMTQKQRHASARLHAWCCDQYGLSKIMPINPHGKFNSTSCPGVIVKEIPRILAEAQSILTREGDHF